MDERQLLRIMERALARGIPPAEIDRAIRTQTGGSVETLRQLRTFVAIPRPAPAQDLGAVAREAAERGAPQPKIDALVARETGGRAATQEDLERMLMQAVEGPKAGPVPVDAARVPFAGEEPTGDRLAQLALGTAAAGLAGGALGTGGAAALRAVPAFVRQFGPSLAGDLALEKIEDRLPPGILTALKAFRTLRGRF